MKNIQIRMTKGEEYRKTEEITRNAFWNFYTPGANEHYLLHQFRKSKNYLPHLDLVVTMDEIIVGHIIYSLGVVTDESGKQTTVLTFGPFSIAPEYQNQGIGTQLLHASLNLVRNEKKYPAIIIYGYPEYYEKFGFTSSKNFGISTPDGRYLKALQVLELYPNALKDIKGKYTELENFNPNSECFQEFDKQFPEKVYEETASQKKFLEMVDQEA